MILTYKHQMSLGNSANFAHLEPELEPIPNYIIIVMEYWVDNMVLSNKTLNNYAGKV
jgi:hypothetical protein